MAWTPNRRGKLSAVLQSFVPLLACVGAVAQSLHQYEMLIRPDARPVVHDAMEAAVQLPVHSMVLLTGLSQTMVPRRWRRWGRELIILELRTHKPQSKLSVEIRVIWARNE